MKAGELRDKTPAGYWPVGKYLSHEKRKA